MEKENEPEKDHIEVIILDDTVPACEECERHVFIRNQSFNLAEAGVVVISILTLITDVVTDTLVTCQYFSNGELAWGALTFSFTIIPSVIIQYFSIRWYMMDEDMTLRKWISHIFQLGPLHRYVVVFKTGMEAKKSRDPVDFDLLYHQQSDVCMLRLFESFMESAPQVVLQLYIMVATNDENYFTGLSAAVSLGSLCWAIAVYSRIHRRVRADKTVISWPGVLLQAIWRIGMISSRVMALVLFATVFKANVFIVIGLHWLVMMMWVFYQDTDFCETWLEERLFNAVISCIYIFCFFNLKEGTSRYRVVIFYSAMFLENILLLVLWHGSSIEKEKLFRYYTGFGFTIVFGGFAIGVISMVLYYRFLHPHASKNFKSTSKSKHMACLKHDEENNLYDHGMEAEIVPRSISPSPNHPHGNKIGDSPLAYPLSTFTTPCSKPVSECTTPVSETTSLPCEYSKSFTDVSEGGVMNLPDGRRYAHSEVRVRAKSEMNLSRFDSEPSVVVSQAKSMNFLALSGKKIRSSLYGFTSEMAKQIPWGKHGEIDMDTKRNSHVFKSEFAESRWKGEMRRSDFRGAAVNSKQLLDDGLPSQITRLRDGHVKIRHSIGHVEERRVPSRVPNRMHRSFRRQLRFEDKASEDFPQTPDRNILYSSTPKYDIRETGTLSNENESRMIPKNQLRRSCDQKFKEDSENSNTLKEIIINLTPAAKYAKSTNLKHADVSEIADKVEKEVDALEQRKQLARGLWSISKLRSPVAGKPSSSPNVSPKAGLKTCNSKHYTPKSSNDITSQSSHMTADPISTQITSITVKSMKYKTPGSASLNYSKNSLGSAQKNKEKDLKINQSTLNEVKIVSNPQDLENKEQVTKRVLSPSTTINMTPHSLSKKYVTRSGKENTPKGERSSCKEIVDRMGSGETKSLKNKRQLSRKSFSHIPTNIVSRNKAVFSKE